MIGRRHRLPARIAIGVAFAFLVLSVSGCGGASSDGVPIGIQDDRLSSGDIAPRERFDLISEVGAELVRVNLRWDAVAATEPAEAENPDDPAYDWARYDEIVEEARERDIELIFTIWGTPDWAADPAVAPGVRPYSRRPAQPGDAGRFAGAAAARYAPRGVSRWEMWNEPNIPIFLRPQFERRGGRWEPASPRIYSEIARAMYPAIKEVDPSAQIAGGVTAPAGDVDPQGCDLQPDCRVRPQDFLDALDAPGLRPAMDAWAHHPYPLRRPTNTTPPNRAYIDLYNLDVLFDGLDRGYLEGTPVWITEFGVATRRLPIYKFWVEPEDQALALEDALARVRAEPRIETFIWYLLQDHAGWASGLLDEAGAPKPAADVLRRAVGG